MGLIIALIAVSIALIMIGIIVHNLVWLLIVGIVLWVASVIFAGVVGRAA